MSELHEKIQLSSEDMRYLQKLFLDNAHSKLKLNLPSSSQDTKDPLTLKIIKMIEDFISEMFEMSRHSLVIDGEDMGKVANMKHLLNEPKELTEPFDMELNQRLRSIYQQVEQETLEVTKLRREFPIKAQSEYKDIIETQFENDVEDTTINTTLDTDKNNEVIPRLQDIIDDYDETLQNLISLKENLPGQASEVEKLKELVKFMETVSK